MMSGDEAVTGRDTAVQRIYRWEVEVLTGGACRQNAVLVHHGKFE